MESGLKHRFETGLKEQFEPISSMFEPRTQCLEQCSNRESKTVFESWFEPRKISHMTKMDVAVDGIGQIMIL